MDFQKIFQVIRFKFVNMRGMASEFYALMAIGKTS